MLTSPRAHPRICSIATRGRGSEGCTDSKRCRTCSAHAAAHKASSRWSESVSVPPRRMVMKRGSRTVGRITVQSPSTSFASVSREVEDLNRRLLRARDAMDRSYAEPLDVRAVAAVAFLSEAHFTRSFRAAFGETPHRYLQRRRVERSMFLLPTTHRDPGPGEVASLRSGGWLRVRAGGAAPGTPRAGPGPPMHDEATAAQLRELITKGALGGLVFNSDDIRGLYETLKSRGVTDFTQEPTDHFYGTDMGVRDPFGNAIRILQQGKVAHKASA